MNPKTQYIRNAITFLEESTPVMADYALRELNALESEHAALVAVAEQAKELVAIQNVTFDYVSTHTWYVKMKKALAALEPAKDEAK